MPASLRVLLFEDNEDDALLLKKELERGGYEPAIVRTDSIPALRTALTTDTWDIVVSDFSVPPFTVLSAIEVVNELGLDVPFIVVSATIDEEAAVSALRSGAHDFVPKNRLARLIPAIERELREQGVRRDQRRLREQLAVTERLASVGTLAAGIAHEINNPLAAALSNTEAALRELQRLQDPDRLGSAIAALDDARDALERVRTITRDVKLFSRVGGNEPAVPVDVHQALEAALRMASSEIRARAKVTRSYGIIAPVRANEARLGQVFLNLLLNAAQAIPEGAARDHDIAVTTSMESGRVAIEIRDTGTGIAPHDLERIFDAFFTTKPEGVGTGLGLAICRRIVTDLNGRIDVESRVGKGTAFRVQLPADDRAIERPRAAAPIAAPVRRGRVLVIDDEPLVGSAISRTISSEHDVVVANSVSHARRAIAGPPFDLILCDLMMPDGSGMQLYEELSARSPADAARMIFLTGGTSLPAIEAFLERVPNAWLEKPFDARELRALINARVAGAADGPRAAAR